MKAQIEQLEKENKSLKEKLEKLQDEYDELYIEKCNASNQWKCCEAENKELKDDLLHYIQREEGYRQEIETLENELSLKESLNEELRKKIDKYKSDL